VGSLRERLAREATEKRHLLERIATHQPHASLTIDNSGATRGTEVMETELAGMLASCDADNPLRASRTLPGSRPWNLIANS
jgi:hypothetical protein